MKIIKGDLIKLALKGEFDIIVHGCNCFCAQKSGLAPQMVKAFQTDKTFLEGNVNQAFGSIDVAKSKIGDINKLGNIDILNRNIPFKDGEFTLKVINAYTQYSMGHDKRHLDYEALTMCLRKINHIFSGETIGLPLIGCGLAGGDWNIVKKIIKQELKDLKIVIVEYDK